MRRNVVSVVPIAVFVIGALIVSISNPGETGSDPGLPPEMELALDLAADLEPFDDCTELLTYFQETAEEMGPGFGRPVAVPDVAVAEEMPVDAVAGGAGSAGDVAESSAPAARLEATGGGTDYSGTNIQEAGVDEPDIVKTDGRRLVAVAQGRLHVLDPAGGAIDHLGSIALPEGAHELFLHADRAIVLTRSWNAVPLPEPLPEPLPVEPGVPADDVAASTVIAPGSSATVVSAVDLSDPRDPRVIDDATFEGDYVTARLHAGTLRLVLRSSPQFVPTEEIDDTEIEAWLPERIEVDGDTVTTEPLVGCDAVARPPEPAGLGTVTLLTIDPSASMAPLDTDTVVADAQTVYASTETLYVATSAWQRASDAGASDTATTELHAFDISGPTEADYVASGRVPGQLLNQWSLSERGGHLRIATTAGSPWAPAGDRAQSQSYLTVLALDGDRLETVGRVGDLGRGETIHAVRYVGDLGFVVTFRRVDPLYAVDLSDPTEPRVLDELKITGFSAYLHPIPDGRLLGVGQEATEEGRAIGTQVSLFDVSDPSALSRLDQELVENAHSPVEHDHRAFLWWEADGAAVVPIEMWDARVVEDLAPDAPTASPPPAEPFFGALVVDVGADQLTVRGRVTHAPHDPDQHALARSVVIDDTLYTMSEAGILASDLDTLDDQGWAAF